MLPNDAKEKQKREVYARRQSYLLTVVFLVLATGITLTGSYYYQNYKNKYKIEIEDQLSSIANLKVDELTRYRQGRLADANILYKNSVFAEYIQNYFERPQNFKNSEQLYFWLEKYQFQYKYDCIYLLDENSKQRMLIPKTAAPVPDIILEQVPAIINSKKIVFQDFFRNEHDGKIYLTILIPIMDKNDTNVIGIVALAINPQNYLYPFIDRWPTPSKTAETLLIRREGNDVLFLNELKFRENTALSLRFTLKNQDIPAAQAVSGKEGIVEGIDYRGVPVLAYVRPVPGSPWFLVARMDISEIYAPLKETLWQVILLVFALLISAGAAIGLIERNQRARFYRVRYELGQKSINSESRYRRLFETAREGILILDADTGVIVDINLSLIELTGYLKEQFLGKKPWDVGFFKDIITNQDKFFELRRQKNIYQENLPSETADGRQINVEFTSAVYMDDDHRIIQCTIRDITERKQADDARFESEARLNEAQRIGKIGSWDWDMVTQEQKWSDNYFAIHGLRPYEVKSSFEYFRSKIHLDDVHILDENHAYLLENREPVSFETRLLQKNGTIKWIQNKVVPIIDDDKIVQLKGVITDITERKKVEAALYESKQNLNDIFETVSEGIAHTTLRGKVISVNRSLEKMLGRPKEEIIGKNILVIAKELLTKKNFNIVAPKLKKLILGKKIEPFQFEFKRKILEIYVNINKKTKRLTGVIHDITERKRVEEALRISELRFRQLFDNMHCGVAIYLPVENGQDFVFWDINCTGEKLNGVRRESVIGKRFSEIFPGAEEYGLIEALIRTYKTGKPEQVQLKRYKDNRIQQWLENTVYCLSSGEVVVIYEDTSERAKAIESLQKSGEKYRHLFNNAEVGMFRVRLDGSEILEVNEKYLHIFNCTRDELLGKPSVNLWVNKDEHEKMVQLLKADGHVVDFECDLFNKQGKVRRCVTSSRLYQDTGILEGSIQDITRRKADEEKIKSSYSQLRKLAAHLQTVREEERAAIARDIHDDLGQSLTALKIGLAMIEKNIKDNKESTDTIYLFNEIKDLQQIIGNTIKAVRKLVSELRPEVLDSLGLLKGLKWLVEEQLKRTRMEGAFSTNMKEINIDKNQTIAIFRILQEGLTNVIRHSGATKINVSFDHIDNNLILVIEDNGIGFGENISDKEDKVGIIGMQERAVILGGEFQISSHKGKGTKVIASIPYK